MSQDPLAAVLEEAEANRRRERANSQAAGTQSIPAATGDGTVAAGSAGIPGNPVTLDANGKIPNSYTYPPSAGQVARTYLHTQTAASTVWQIAHNLGGYPPPVIFDIDGTEIEAEVRYPDDNHMTVIFGRPKAGSARLSL